ncbi:hypothetical protein OF829_09505 [Sphingomonas sp. LB-2]|uniref:hypothetical protein n=1 Tax=Sphingomonas caeni TaxID=2984949 RepID=UPI002230B0FE|nr:hypothetical protein [Sphingomonas caeni]MCW3847478.1 hypothetical protein [Sphingomonas caeni]
MSSVFLGRGKDARELRLGKLLGEGAAGKVFAIEGMPGSAAKLYHGEKESRQHEAKIAAMIAHPPDLPPAEHNRIAYPQISWPEAKLFDRAGRFIGFLMPEIDFGRSTSLVNLLQKNSRRIEKLSDYYGYRVLVARNLASVFAELHRAGHHMIDMKPANLRFYPQVCWMAVVDTDGFSIQGRGGRIPADVMSDEYIAPDSWKRKPQELGEQQDLFALAVIIFQLLNNGVHPFAGSAGGTAQATDLQTRINEGLYPYAMRPKPGLAPSAASVHRMFRRGTRVMFDCAFLPGGRRPSAEEWRDHIDSLMDQLTPCGAKPDSHIHFGAGCGFCGHEARVAAAKARPAVKPTAVAKKPAVVAQPIKPARRAMSPAARRVAMRHTAPLTLRRPPRRKQRGGVTAMLAAIALLGSGATLVATGVVDPAAWRDMIPGGVAQAADTQGIPPLEVDGDAPAAKIAAFDEPREYLVLPAGGALTVALREGPGENYLQIARLGLHDAVIGTGTGSAPGGGDWVWVTRASDGLSGYVHKGGLLERAPSGVAGEPPASEAEKAAAAEGKRLVDARYQRLLGKAAGYDRTYLMDGQRLWEAQRRRCDDAPDPVPCRIKLDARRKADLEDWGAAERSDRNTPDLPPATLSALR